MADDLIDPHEAEGPLELVAVRYAGGRSHAIGVHALRWIDKATGRLGSSTRARLVLYLERGGEVVIRHREEFVPVEVVPAADDRGAVLNALVDGSDLVLALPTY